MRPQHIDDRDLMSAAEDAEARMAPAVGRHLKSCDLCQRRLDEFRTTLGLAAAVPAPGWSPLQSETLVHRVRRSTHARQARRLSAWKPAVAGAALSLVAVFTVQGLLQEGPNSPTPGLAQEGTTSDDVAATSVVADEAGGEVDAAEATDDEMATWIESYLIETATDDELIVQFDAVSEDALYAILDD